MSIAAVKLNVGSAADYNVYDLQGHMRGSVSLTGRNSIQVLNAAGIAKGVYMLKQVNGSNKFIVNSAK